MKIDCVLKDCPLHGHEIVPPKGNEKAKIIIIGESPGHVEVKRGEPFIGRAGQLLRSHVKKAGLDWDSLFITNSAKCLIDKAGMDSKAIADTLRCCRKYLEYTISNISPKAVIICGDIALWQVLGKKGITKMRGIWTWSSEFNCWTMPTFHPAYILRNRTLESLFAGDISAVAEFAKDGYILEESCY